jgi:hypothetical protein
MHSGKDATLHQDLAKEITYLREWTILNIWVKWSIK